MIGKKHKHKKRSSQKSQHKTVEDQTQKPSSSSNHTPVAPPVIHLTADSGDVKIGMEEIEKSEEMKGKRKKKKSADLGTEAVTHVEPPHNQEPSELSIPHIPIVNVEKDPNHPTPLVATTKIVSMDVHHDSNPSATTTSTTCPVASLPSSTKTTSDLSAVSPNITEDMTSESESLDHSTFTGDDDDSISWRHEQDVGDSDDDSLSREERINRNSNNSNNPKSDNPKTLEIAATSKDGEPPTANDPSSPSLVQTTATATTTVVEQRKEPKKSFAEALRPRLPKALHAMIKKKKRHSKGSDGLVQQTEGADVPEESGSIKVLDSNSRGQVSDHYHSTKTHSSSTEYTRTATSHIIISWEFSSSTCTIEQKEGVGILASFNELESHTTEHAAYLIEVLEDEDGHLKSEQKYITTTSSGAVVKTTSTDSTSPSSSSASCSHPQQNSLHVFKRAMSAAYIRSEATLKKKELERLANMTYFDKDEIRELHILFNKIAGYSPHITRAAFDKFIPELSDPLLRQAIFAGFDKSSEFDYKISFDEFVLALSMMCRGTLEERASVVFNMCSTNSCSKVLGSSPVSQPKVSRDLVFSIVSRISSVMESLGFSTRDYGNPRQVVDSVFLKQAPTQNRSDFAEATNRVKFRLVNMAREAAHHNREESAARADVRSAQYHEGYDVGDEYDNGDDSDDNHFDDEENHDNDDDNDALSASEYSDADFHVESPIPRSKLSIEPQDDQIHASALPTTISKVTTDSPSLPPIHKKKHQAINQDRPKNPIHSKKEKTSQGKQEMPDAPADASHSNPPTPSTAPKTVHLEEISTTINSNSTEHRNSIDSIPKESNDKNKSPIATTKETESNTGTGSHHGSPIPAFIAKITQTRSSSPHPSSGSFPKSAKISTAKTKFETKLNQKQFLIRCKNEPDLAECFGLFDFFNAMVVEPIVKLCQEQTEVISKSSLGGYILKERGSVSRKISSWGDKRYFLLKDGFLGYSKKPGSELLRVIYVKGAAIKPSISSTKFQFTLIAPFFSRRMWCDNAEQAQIWVTALRCLQGKKQRFKSFAPIRKQTHVLPLVNGKEYFDALLQVLQQCRRRLLISGWYLSPGLLLKRGSKDVVDQFRLDNVILDAASRGVSVYIIIYAAPTFSFDLQPSYVCNFFNNLHPNIYCIMHPNSYVPSMWSHHQKMVICDETVAFIGGIDLCYGRYEDSEYRLTDVDEVHFPGRDYCNVFWEGESNGPSQQPTLDRRVQPRMPWQDVQVQLTGMAAYDVAFNFIQRWSHIVHEGVDECKSIPFIFPSHSIAFDESQSLPTIDASTGEPYKDDFCQPIQKSLSSQQIPKEKDNKKRRGSTGSYENTGEDHENATDTADTADTATTESISLLAAPPVVPPYQLPWDSRLPAPNISLNDINLGYSGCDVQIIRSVSTWSSGTPAAEQSIYKAYLALIRDAQHFIYIQNQYFISSVETPSPKNRIAQAIYERVKQAISLKENFKVLILCPCIPGGYSIAEASTRYMLKYTYRTICRGGHSILEKLKRDFPTEKISNWIQFATPRQIGRLGNAIISEPVYIHCKIMIVDDKRAIIGSANINDRSMRGSRDSEIACVIESDSEESIVKIQMNGQDFNACLPVHKLRVRMWADLIGVKLEHSKFSPSPEDQDSWAQIQDPITGFDALLKRADTNTKYYIRTFPGMYPSIQYKLTDFKSAAVSISPDDDPIVTEQRLEDSIHIKGLITSWPYDFMRDEEIGIGLFEKEYMVPRIVFL